MHTLIMFLQEQSPLMLLLSTVLTILVLFLLILVINLCTFQSLNTFQTEDLAGEPLLSILVPARDEEQNIEACVRSLLAQDYAHMEVLVLDDGSTDATSNIVQSIQAELLLRQSSLHPMGMLDEPHIVGEGLVSSPASSPVSSPCSLPPKQKERLQLLKGKTLPTGWIGKNYACYQLAQAAQGAYLLFTDADTVHAPTMARSVIACMQHYQVQFLTAQPMYIQKSLGERLVIPLINFAVFTLLPVALVYQRPEPSLAMGNGQLLCFECAAYKKIDGHASVKGQILEDVLLARTCKKAGLRIIFVDALDQVQCRMYHSFREVWSGFSKNLFAFYNYKLPFALVAALFNLLLFALPALLLCIAPFVHFPARAISLALADYLVATLLRILLALRFTRQEKLQTFLLCCLHPISMTLQSLILLNSIRWRYRKAGTLWKGRHY